MKLFAFKPPGGCHGPLSLFVCAESEQAACDAIRKHMAEQRERDPAAFDYDYQDGDLSEYVITVADPGVVIENGNE